MSREIKHIAHVKGHTYYITDPKGSEVDWDKRESTAFEYSYLVSELKNLLGQVLTLMDATLTDERQLKAVKDIIREQFATKMSDLWEVSEPNFEEIIKESSEEAFKGMTDEEIAAQAVSLEEAMGA